MGTRTVLAIGIEMATTTTPPTVVTCNRLVKEGRNDTFGASSASASVIGTSAAVDFGQQNRHRL